MTKELHTRNIHNELYDFKALIEAYPSLDKFVTTNNYGNLSIDFSDSKAVLTLNTSLLYHHYKIQFWSIPKGHLCPPIPGRVDYLHYIADILAEDNNKDVPVGTKVKGLDIGTGTGCIYPILGNAVYGWKFVATDINSESINHCKNLLNKNAHLKKNIKVRYQSSIDSIFNGIVKSDEKFDFTMCNPPFFTSLKEAKSASNRKTVNLNFNKEKKGHIQTKTSPNKETNFGGIEHELWCPGGESGFIKKMIKESIEVQNQCRWFTTLVSNKSNLPVLISQLDGYEGLKHRTIQMKHGHKVSHILAWSFK